MIGSNIRGLGKREETEIKIKERQANKKERKELNGNYYYKRLDRDMNKIHFKMVNF